MRRALFGLLFSLLAVAVQAQERHQAYAYDLDANTLTFPYLLGINGATAASDIPPIKGPGFVKTTGSSVNLTENLAGINPFTDIAVDDVLVFVGSDGVVSKRVVVTRTDAANVVLDTAIDLSNGSAWSYYKFGSTTGDVLGWVDVSDLGPDKVVTVQWDQGDLATGLLYVVQCLSNTLDPKPIQVWPTGTCGLGTLTSSQCLIPVASVGTSTIGRIEINLPSKERACRVGMLRSGNDTSDATTNRERISVSFNGFVVER